MKRKWRIPADREDGTISQEALVKNLFDLAVMLDHGGGVGAITLARRPTGMPDEHVTVDAVVSWQSHADTKPARERASGEVLPATNGHAEPATVAQAVAHAESAPEDIEVDEADVPPNLRD